jgi:hypothetical protein
MIPKKLEMIRKLGSGKAADRLIQWLYLTLSGPYSAH